MYEEDDTNYDADITQICDFTGLCAAQALSLLRAHKNDVGVAINEYMDKGADAVPLPKLIPLAEAKRRSSASAGPARGNRGGEEMPLMGRSTPLFEQREEADSVRPPIEPHEEILVDTLEARALNRRAIKRPRRTGASAFDGFRNFAVETNRQEQMLAMGNGSSYIDPMFARNEAHVRRLEDLFRPPLDIIFHGTFTTARSVCMIDGKWLMVNPQSPTEFSCQELNRDIWSDPAIKSIVQANFVFWQVYIDSEEGLAYHQYYPVDKFPYVSIIDPRTGELLKKWNVIDKSHFAEQLVDFLQKNDTEKVFCKDGISNEKLGAEAQVSTSAIGIGRINLGKSVAFAGAETGGGAGAFAIDPLETAGGGADSTRGVLKRGMPSPERDAPIPLKRADRDREGGRRPFRAEVRAARRRGRVVSSTVTSAGQAEPASPQEPEASGLSAASPSAESCPLSPSCNCPIVTGETGVGNTDLESGSDSEDGSDADGDIVTEGPGDSSTQIKLCVHLPEKGRKIVSFPASGKIQLLHRMLAEEGYPRREFEYVLNYPKRMICSKEAGLSSFASYGIAHNDTIFVSLK